ncbi:MAG: hypothetical protein MJ198_06705 [Bacteroidales bacterium]|nr:hypothetical protein [Bacteroidales bacterium]
MNLLKKLFGQRSLHSIAKKAGYVTDQMGIQKRYVRENSLWKSHLENTKNFIVENISLCNERNSVAVLGSGWLLDVPIEELTQKFNDVYLYDIVHPEPVVVKTKKYSNVHLVERDLTGGAIELAEQSETFQQFLSYLQEIKCVDWNQFDMVVSVNILNQLDILLCDFLSEKFSASEEQLKEVRRIVQQNHINELPNGKSCLIFDYREENKTVIDNQIQTKDLLYCTLPESSCCREWDWLFDSSQMYHKGKNTILKVKAMTF